MNTKGVEDGKPNANNLGAPDTEQKTPPPYQPPRSPFPAPSGVEDGMGDDQDETGCCFPGRCCMPGYHLRSECHTAEMMQQMIEDGEA